jgi:MoxR-like ATPase
VQFTADLMPSDLVGRQRLRAQQGGLRLPPRPGVRPGAAGRRDQPRRPQDAERAARGHGGAAGLGRERHARAARPFFVIATQNPSDQLGTYPLPESQLDRFLLRITLGYPDRASERALLAGEDRRARWWPACSR